ncbi:purine-cytosine permease family protein [Shewanella frigidimarina]|uniref:Putative nucleoside transport protein n=1 Tax=Shewanella frigidimarina (strain NCIMB 400) TaxID=318167 RepID=Q082R8_SHEFN|nr:membrane protein [Shewanella frigidimarina]ABI71747.1 putative nucleoside transport protein [Shewanella frigidimarina NCIMB 400]
MTISQHEASFKQTNEEQLPVAKNKLHGWKHFAGLYAGEHVAATEFVIGATFVALGASTIDILLGLLIGNLLAMCSWWLLTAPIAVETRLSLYNYLNKIAGDSMTKLYNWANVIIFSVISAAMITVSSTAVRFLFDIPAQLNWYPSSLWFVMIVLAVGSIVVVVAMYGFSTVADFSKICAPWLFVIFIAGSFTLFPVLSNHVIGSTTLTGWQDFMTIGDSSIWTGLNDKGEPGIGLLEVIGFAWAANSITHFGLIDMAIFRFAKRKSYGLISGVGMFFGHYLAWISAGIMGAGTAVLLKTTITQLDPGDVAYHALGFSGFVIIIIAGWTTANANLYRAGLAAQSIFVNHSRERTTAIVGLVTVVIACFPFVFSQMLPLLTYAGLLVVPVGGIVFAEHVLFPKIGLTRYWAKYQKLSKSTPAIASWALALVFGFGLNSLDIISFYYLFIPTWIFTIIIYTVLAKKYGADLDYTGAILLDEKEQQQITEYQDEMAKDDKPHVEDGSKLTKLLNSFAVISLMVISILAAKVMFYSPTMTIYAENKSLFETVCFVCTIIYFSCSYIALKLRDPHEFNSMLVGP